MRIALIATLAVCVMACEEAAPSSASSALASTPPTSPEPAPAEEPVAAVMPTPEPEPPSRAATVEVIAELPPTGCPSFPRTWIEGVNAEDSRALLTVECTTSGLTDRTNLVVSLDDGAILERHEIARMRLLGMADPPEEPTLPVWIGRLHGDLARELAWLRPFGVTSPRPAGIEFTRDGHWALVPYYGRDGVTYELYEMEGGRRDRIRSAVMPMFSADGSELAWLEAPVATQMRLAVRRLDGEARYPLPARAVSRPLWVDRALAVVVEERGRPCLYRVLDDEAERLRCLDTRVIQPSEISLLELWPGHGASVLVVSHPPTTRTPPTLTWVRLDDGAELARVDLDYRPAASRWLDDHRLFVMGQHGEPSAVFDLATGARTDVALPEDLIHFPLDHARYATELLIEQPRDASPRLVRITDLGI